MNRRHVVFGAVAVVVLAVAGGGAAWWFSPESPSEASFTRAVNQYYTQNAEVRDRIICADNLPYQKDSIRVDEYSQSTRRLMDMLAQAGVYEAPRQESSGGFFPRTQYVYALSAEGKKWVRNNRLCLGGGVQAKEVRGFDQVEQAEGQSYARAGAQLEVTQEAEWLGKASDRDALLQALNKERLSVQLPLSLVDGKWAVVERNSFASSSWPRTASRFAAPKEEKGILASLLQMISFSSSHPLVGKWQDDSGMFALEFTRDSIIQNGVSIKATFESKGDIVTVKSDNPMLGAMNFRIKDRDTAQVDLGLSMLTVKRIH